MTVQEIQRLQVGNLIIIGEDENVMIVVVDRISRLTSVICKEVDRPVHLYEGHYLDFENMESICGWRSPETGFGAMRRGIRGVINKEK